METGERGREFIELTVGGADLFPDDDGTLGFKLWLVAFGVVDLAVCWWPAPFPLMFMCAGKGESWSSRTMSGFQLCVGCWMLRFVGLVLFRRESEGGKASGLGMGLVGGVENMGVAGESIVVGPGMAVKSMWVSFVQVALASRGLFEGLYGLVGSDSRNDGRRREDGEQSPCQLTSPRR